MTVEEREIYKQSIDCYCGEPIEFDVVKAKGYKGEFVSKLIFEPLKFDTMIKMQPLLSSLVGLKELVDDEKLEADFMSTELKFLGDQLKVIADNQDKLIKLLCMAYHNQKGASPSWCEDYFKCNFEASDIYIIFRSIIARLNVSVFTNSISMMKKSMSLI